MEINLPPEFEKFIQNNLNKGFYNSANDMIIAGLQMLVEQERSFANTNQEEINYYNTKIEEGISSARAGRLYSAAEVYKTLVELRRQYKQD